MSGRVVKNWTTATVGVWVLLGSSGPPTQRADGQWLMHMDSGPCFLRDLEPGAVYEVPREYDAYRVLVAIPENLIANVDVYSERGA